MLHCDMLHYDNYLHCKYMSHRVPYLDKGIGSTELTPGRSNSIHEAAKQQKTAVNQKLNTKKRFSHHRRSKFKKRSLFNSTQGFPTYSYTAVNTHEARAHSVLRRETCAH